MHARLSRQSGPLFTAGRFLGGLAVLLFSGGALPPVANADIQQPPRARAPGERRLQRRDGPPAALPSETAVEQAGSVQIILRAEGQVGKMIYFLVRNPPQHGTITGPPAQVSRNAASVVYVQNPGDAAADDEFTFSVQATGSGVSAPETVRIRILPAPPVIEVVPPELDFGAVKAGEIARAEFTLENRGGSEASGHVEPPAPWVVDGAPEYHLPRGASQTFRLVFQPKDERVFSSEMHFQFEARNGVRLVGTGLMDAAQKAAAAASASAARAAGNGSINGNVVLGRNNNAVGGGALAAGGANGGPGGGSGLAAGGAGASSAGGRTGTAAPAGGPSAPATAVDGAPGRPDLAGAAPTPRATRNGGVNDQGQPGRPASLAIDDATSVVLNDANVEKVEVRGVDGGSVELAWMPPVPQPASYRVEIRYLSIDAEEKLRIDWRPYAQTQFYVRRDAVTARLRNLPLGGFQMMRVVAVDSAGRLAAPSPMITVLMPQPATWWSITPLKLLVLLLVACLVLVVRRRLENRAILREIDDSRRAANKEAGIAWKT